MEHLDHRQLLSVNFTGNVATDFPASTTPGVVVLPDSPNVTHPTISPDIAPIVKVSGFDINGIRVTYTPSDDTLSVGIQQPLSQQPSHPGPVIAGDSDNNGNDGTVDPAVTAIKGPGFQDFQDFGGSESMGVFLDLKGTGSPDIVAGYAVNDPRSPKQYQVARAIVNPGPTSPPDYGAELPLNEGNVYKVNSPAHPNLEFAIAHFSQLYLAETGKALTPGSVIKIGAAAGSGDDTGIGEAFFPALPVTIGNATPPPTPTCPPVSPPVFINPHANSHINTAHDTLIRVNVLGSSGFDVTKIIPGSVTLGGAHPVFNFDRFINGDEWPDATFVFRGTDVKLPSGFTEATVSGKLTDGTSFSSSVRVFNRDASYYSPGSVHTQMGRQTRRDTRKDGFLVLPPGSPVAGTAAAPAAGGSVAAGHTVTVSTGTPAGPKVRISAATPGGPGVRANRHAGTTAGPVVSIKRRQPVVSVPQGQTPAPRVNPKLQSSLDQYVRDNGAVNLKSGKSVATGGA